MIPEGLCELLESEEVRAARKVLCEYEYFYKMGEDEGWDF